MVDNTQLDVKTPENPFLDGLQGNKKAKLAGDLIIVAYYMREGAKKRPKATGKYFDAFYVNVELKSASCAFGAVWDTVKNLPLEMDAWRATRLRSEISSEVITRRFPALRCYVQMPGTEYHQTIYQAVVDLNDKAAWAWSREKIADWLEEIARDMAFGLEWQDDWKSWEDTLS